jgi:predicted RNase H-like nuclease (RuvC/YqgF family)
MKKSSGNGKEYTMSDDKIKKLEEEILAKKKEVEELKYGDLRNAWKEFEAASEIATQKYNKYRDIAKDKYGATTVMPNHFNLIDQFFKW